MVYFTGKKILQTFLKLNFTPNTLGCYELMKTLYQESLCLFQDDRSLMTTSMGRIASYYYLSHQTMTHFAQTLTASLSNEQVLKVLCDAYEYSQIPVRHNEDLLNAYVQSLPLPVQSLSY